MNQVQRNLVDTRLLELAEELRARAEQAASRGHYATATTLHYQQQGVLHARLVALEALSQ